MLVESISVFQGSLLLQSIPAFFKNTQAVLVAVKFQQGHHLHKLGIDIRFRLCQRRIGGAEHLFMVVNGGSLQQRAQ